jgi:predicted DsbA family dithiol-disulfide isomerase
VESPLIIDVWADVVCPWCFIGKRRLERAIAGLPDGTKVEVHHRAFQLQPEISGVVATSKLLAEKYQLDSSQVLAMQEKVCSIADGEGLCYNLGQTMLGNTKDAHRVLLWSKSIDKQDALLEEMFSSYFEKSASIFGREDILDIVERAGLDRPSAAEILEGELFTAEVQEDQDLAVRLGASGVPFFVIDRKIAFAGAQPQEIFDKALRQALYS